MRGSQALRLSPGPRCGAVIAILLVGGMLAWVFWMVAATAGKEAGRSKLAFEGRSAQPARDLRRCLEDPRIDGLAIDRRGGTWQTRVDAPNVASAANNARHTRVEVIEAGAARIVRFYTRDGRPVHRVERALIQACLAGRSS